MTVIDENVVKIEKQIEKNNKKIEKLNKNAQKNEKTAKGARKFNNFVKKGGFLIPVLPAVGVGIFDFSNIIIGPGCSALDALELFLKAISTPTLIGAAMAVGALILGAVVGGVAIGSKFAKEQKCEQIENENAELLEKLNRKENVNFAKKTNEQTKFVEKQALPKFVETKEDTIVKK